MLSNFDPSLGEESICTKSNFILHFCAAYHFWGIFDIILVQYGDLKTFSWMICYGGNWFVSGFCFIFLGRLMCTCSLMQFDFRWELDFSSCTYMTSAHGGTFVQRWSGKRFICFCGRWAHCKAFPQQLTSEKARIQTISNACYWNHNHEIRKSIQIFKFQ